LLLLPIAAVAHSFPSPDDPEFQAERDLADAISATQAADAAGVSSATTTAARSVYDLFLPWPAQPGTIEVRACFWNGTPDLQRAIVNSDAAWEKIANITINYTEPNGSIRICLDTYSAQIRISLDGNDARLDYDDLARPRIGYWSVVGRQAGFTPQGKPPGSHYLVTVNLPSLTQYVSRGDWSAFNFLVRHEMGHARGLLHEHQRQTCANWFDVDKIAASQHWTVFYAQAAVASFDQLQGAFHPRFVGGYDILSVMQYNFEKSWYREVVGQTNPCERATFVEAPSPGDKATLVAMYGAFARQPVPRALIIAQPGIDPRAAFEAAIGTERARIGLLSQREVENTLTTATQAPGEAARRGLELTIESGKQLSDSLDRLTSAISHLDDFERGVH
jgi:hypothetical protein